MRRGGGRGLSWPYWALLELCSVGLRPLEGSQDLLPEGPIGVVGDGRIWGRCGSLSGAELLQPAGILLLAERLRLGRLHWPVMLLLPSRKAGMAETGEVERRRCGFDGFPCPGHHRNPSVPAILAVSIRPVQGFRPERIPLASLQPRQRHRAFPSRGEAALGGLRCEKRASLPGWDSKGGRAVFGSGPTLQNDDNRMTVSGPVWGWLGDGVCGKVRRRWRFAGLEHYKQITNRLQGIA
jgi:hypothetical protein